MFFNLNTTKVGGHEYSMADLRQLKRLEDFGLDGGYYGGRIKNIGLTDTDVLLLISDSDRERDGLHVIDTAVVKLDSIPLGTIRELANVRGIKWGPRSAKEDLIAKLEGKKVKLDDGEKETQA